jgi:3-phosphoshikimate 1-carboxyvinyltransferase|tara:strand:+ start:50141 stop:51367 length:1227 start_codon:yes stop_codon:yes gene_type:complete
VFKITKKSKSIEGVLNISGSKSESNRLLILRAFTSYFDIKNISDSDDTNVMISAINSNQEEIDIGHAGTAMRFLTSYFSSINNSSVILTGSKRMKERPISILVDALRELEVEISYIKNEGYPPIKIKGKEINKKQVKLPANVSSQYITSLMMLGVSLQNGLVINLSTEITSLPYIEMTKKIIERIGGNVKLKSNQILIDSLSNKKIPNQLVESDWSSASYFYSMVALSDLSDLTLKTYYKDSIQGDSDLAEIYKKFGVKTTYINNGIHLSKSDDKIEKKISLDLSNNPDLAQTIVVTCLGLQIDCDIYGLQTLKIKETDRLIALKSEIEKFGVDKIEVTESSLHLENKSQLKSNISIDTYDDHRMAMSFAPLSLLDPIKINDPLVVTKSYVSFWDHLEKIGFEISKNK